MVLKMKKIIVGGLLGFVSAFSYADLKCANLKSQGEINQCASKRVSVLDGEIGGIYNIGQNSYSSANNPKKPSSISKIA